MRELIPCQLCGQLHAPATLIEFGGMRVCTECMDTSTIRCDRCGVQLWRSENAGDNDTYLCDSCFENYYCSCSECSTLLRNDDAHYEDDDEDTPLCYDCYRQRMNRYTIQSYGYKPLPIFYGESGKFMGVELELDCGGESDASARTLMEIANTGDEHAYCKHDGSLDSGFEVVSHPMTLDYHMHQMPWAEVLSKARELGYKSHQARTCGLHIHVSRRAFGDTEKEQDEVIARILYFIEKNWDELKVASRRTARQLEQWCNRIGFRNQPKELLDTAKKNYRSIRYVALNLCNADTVEFRIFRGTLRYNTFAATLQLVHRICEVATCLSDEEVKNLSWSVFAAGCTKYPELVQYLKERRLYINEPVEAEAEV